MTSSSLPAPRVHLLHVLRRFAGTPRFAPTKTLPPHGQRDRRRAAHAEGNILRHETRRWGRTMKNEGGLTQQKMAGLLVFFGWLVGQSWFRLG